MVKAPGLAGVDGAVSAALESLTERLTMEKGAGWVSLSAMVAVAVGVLEVSYWKFTTGMAFGSTWKPPWVYWTMPSKVRSVMTKG